MKTLAALFLLLSLPVLADPLAPPPEAETTDSGLITLRLAEGTGSERPSEASILRLRYTLRTPDGTTIASVEEPAVVLIAAWKMIEGWREAASMMVQGETRRAWVSADLGAKVPAGFDYLIIDTELLEIIPPPSTPVDVAAPPEGAATTKSGLSYIVLRKGTGTKKVSSRSNVTVHYSGWTTDGKLFDSSLKRGEPSQLPVQGVIRGWQEMLALMVPGERVRVWIPERLAYRGERGKPKGTLVFEIELVDVQ